MQIRDDEPLPAEPDEIEEISPEFILQDEPAPAPSASAPAPASVRAPPEPAEPARRPTAPAEQAEAVRPVPATRRAEPPPERAASRQGFPLVVALVFLAVGGGTGFFAGMLWERQRAAPSAAAPAPAAASPASVEPPASPPDGASDAPVPEPKRAAKGAPKATKGAKAPAVRTAAKVLEGKGRLVLTAPPDAEVYLDGRRVGRGSVTIGVAPGAHRIEVRLGKARVAERFEVGPNETWTYDVTPTR